MRRDLFNSTRFFLVVLLIFAVNACAKKTIPAKQEFPTESAIGTTEPHFHGSWGYRWHGGRPMAGTGSEQRS